MRLLAGLDLPRSASRNLQHALDPLPGLGTGREGIKNGQREARGTGLLHTTFLCISAVLVGVLVNRFSNFKLLRLCRFSTDHYQRQHSTLSYRSRLRQQRRAARAAPLRRTPTRCRVRQATATRCCSCYELKQVW